MPERVCARCAMVLAPGRRVCAQCGATFARRRLIIPLTFLAVLQVLGALGYVQYRRWKAMRYVPDPAEFVHDLAPDRVQPPAGWAYYDTTDPLTGDVTHHARVLGLGIPAAGQAQTHFATGTLILRQSPLYGTSAVIELQHPQDEPVEDACVLKIQFDGGAPEAFTATTQTDASSVKLGLDRPQEFIGRMLASHSLSVAAQLSPKIERIASFAVGNLKWHGGSNLSIARERASAWLSKQVK